MSDDSCTRYQELMSSLKTDGRGVVHLGNDGVLRSFDAGGNVVDYRQLSPEQIRYSIDMYDAIGTGKRENLESVYRGVDGREVPIEQVLKPDEDAVPAWVLQKRESVTPSNTPAVVEREFE